MNISIFGTGYVGLVSGACLAEAGHNVVCVDVNESIILNLNNGILPIWEPGLDILVNRNASLGRLSFTTDANFAISHGLVLFIAVGTPPDEDGSADLRYVLSVVNIIANSMNNYKLIVNKSTVPVGTAHQVRKVVSSVLAQKSLQNSTSPLLFDVVSNPEFLKEGSAVNDFQNPERIIIGAESKNALKIMKELYEPFNLLQQRLITMDVRSAELTKYAANAMLATKISFINEIANLAELLGADIEQVRKGIGSDPRIGFHFINPGCGYGGSCFPKDVQALAYIANSIGYDAKLLRAVEEINNFQKTVLFTKLTHYFGSAEMMQGKTIALWGLSFKPNTDDMRAAPSRDLMESLWKVGAKVQAFDPIAIHETTRIYGERHDLSLFTNKYDALQNADALVICTEWQDFRDPDFNLMASRMIEKVVFDGRNLYKPVDIEALGWTYISIGRAIQ